MASLRNSAAAPGRVGRRVSLPSLRRVRALTAFAVLVVLAVAASTSQAGSGMASRATAATRWQQADAGPFEEPDDPQYGQRQQDYMREIGMPVGWALRNPDPDEPVIIAIVDTGVDVDHPDLADRVLPGRNFVDDNDDVTDEADHGTPAAGMAAAIADNGEGVAGSSWNARVLPVKANTHAEKAEGIEWAVDQGASVISMSWGSDLEELRDALDYAAANDVVMVAGAGNVPAHVPAHVMGIAAAHADVLAVGNTDPSGKVVGRSTWHEGLDVVAPGRNTWTTRSSAEGADYGTFGGTSASAPLVAGIAALLRAAEPDLSAPEVLDRLRETAQDRGPAGLDPYYGWGLVDAGAALGGPAQPPAPPPALDDREPDGRPVRASDVALGESTLGSIRPAGDEDWHELTVGEPGFYRWRVEPAPSGRHWPLIEAYDPELRRVGLSLTEKGEANELVIHAEEAGSYWLRVRNEGGSSSHGAYTVTAEALGDEPSSVFAAPELYPVDGPPESVATGDLTGDGRDEVVTTTTDDSGELSLHLWEQTEDGTLAEPRRLDTNLTSSGHGPIDVSDLDGDGQADIALGARAGIHVFPSDGSSLDGPFTVNAATGAVRDLAVADLNGDGDAQLAAIGNQDLLVLTRNGPDWETDWQLEQTTSGEQLLAVEVGDLNGSGRLDLVAFDRGSKAVRAFLQQAGGGFVEEESGPLDINFIPLGMDVGDVTADGHDDVVVSAPHTDKLFLLSMAGDATFGEPTAVASSGLAGAVAVGDVTGDEQPEILTLHVEPKRVGIIERDGDGGLADQEFMTPPLADSSWWTPYGVFGLVVGDVDDSGEADVAIADGEAGLVTLRQLPLAGPPEGNQAWVRGIQPAAHAVEVAADVTPTVTFARPVASGSVTADTVELFDGRNGETVPAEVAFADGVATLTPQAELDEPAPYRVRVSGVEAPDGAAMRQPFDVRFWVGEHPSAQTVVIAGTVTDATSDAPIPGATVTATGPTTEETTTDEAGEYELGGFADGFYTVTADADGYEPARERVATRVAETLPVEVNLALQPAAACPAGEVTAAGFDDVSAGSVHAEAVDCVAWYGISKGTSATTYTPAGATTRAQMAAFIARTMETAGVDLGEPGDPGFDDDDGHPLEDRINQLAAAGVVEGTSATTYSPQAPVTRAQMASFLVRAYEAATGESLAEAEDDFTDTGGVHADNIAKAAEAGWAKGVTPDRYNPSGPVRRDQQASFLARMLDTLADDGLVNPPA